MGRAWSIMPSGAGLLLLAGSIAALTLSAADVGAQGPREQQRAGLGEARDGSLTVAIAPAVAGIAVDGPAGRPIVVIDAGHGGRDPGAKSVSGAITEKQLTLAMAAELRQRLLERGRVRVAMTRTDDRYLTLDQRADLARQLGASLFLSLHMDSAPNPLARGASVYSLSDVASDGDAARFAQSENGGSAFATTRAGSAEALLADLALRDQMSASADLAARLVRKSRGEFGLRPEPHRFAAFHVLRRSGVPAVLFEAGYISNPDDELLLADAKHRAAIVRSLAQAVEADIATRLR